MNKSLITICIFILSALFASISFAKNNDAQKPLLTQNEIIQQLGWLHTGENRCGGYYIEQPFTYPQTLLNKEAIQITSDQLLFAQHGTSVGSGKVTISRQGQQIIANQAYLYRDPATGKVNAIELINDVTLREPNSLIVASRGRYTFATKSEILEDILYRTTIYGDTEKKPEKPSFEELQSERHITQLNLWGEAKKFEQNEPEIYDFDQASFTTCPPDTSVWKIKANHITLNKKTGRGAATDARIYVKNIPILYTPYINFPIDKRRKTGFLWPSFGKTTSFGVFLKTPFYWDMAPNYDMTLTPALIKRRGTQLSTTFRYLDHEGSGNLLFEILPHDKQFIVDQEKALNNPSYKTTSASIAELRELENASSTRKSISYQNTTQFNDHWSNDVDYNWVSDSYYLQDFSNNVNQVTQNQLLQQGEVDYKSQNWSFTTRAQAYQTLHPVGTPNQFYNQYTRLPQFILNGDYPDMPGGFDYFVNNEATHFIIQNNPGSSNKFPMGNRFHTMPGISRSVNFTYLTITPRFQFDLTQYEIGDVNSPNNSKNPSRVLPIFDINNQFYFDRSITFLSKSYRQTLEPQLYYTYIPFRNQSELPVFDTSVNTLTYDQLFLYNRFSGIDRINDANQIAAGVTTRFIDQQSGKEKIKIAAGQIFYFTKRKVTLCNSATDPNCQNNGSDDTPDNPNNRSARSPLSAMLGYNVNDNWSLNALTIYNSNTHPNQITNQSVTVHYQPLGTQKIINAGYNFVRNGEILPGDVVNHSAANLSVTDLSFNWPVFRDWSLIGRWTQNWNHNYFQNLLYGLQYDSCCWAVRLVAGRLFTNLNVNNKPVYNTQFYLQFALNGLGPIPVGSSDPSQLLSTNIAGYQANFGRDF